MKKTVYLDTTIPSFKYDIREKLQFQIDITNKWWEHESKYYDIWISNETYAELNDGDYPNKNNILNFIENINVLEPDNKIIEIAQIYIDNYLMPRVLKGDAIHLAYASYYKIDFLLTWNCNHLANANKRQHIRIINTKLNLGIPDIITPLELFTEDLNDNSK